MNELGFRDFNGGIGSACYECQDRHPACHDTCERYIEEKAKHEERRQQIRSAREKANAYDLYKYEAILKTKKKTSKGWDYSGFNYKR